MSTSFLAQQIPTMNPTAQIFPAKQYQPITSVKEEQLSSESNPSSTTITAAPNRTNLIINYIPPKITNIELQKLFESVGAVRTAKIIRSKETGFSLGYGFVEYYREEDANQAIKSLNGHQIQNKNLKVSFARPSSTEIQNSNLIITGLPSHLHHAQLLEIFSGFGDIITSRIVTDRVKGISKGTAFIRFDKKQQAQEALKSLTGTTPQYCDHPINIRLTSSIKRKGFVKSKYQPNSVSPAISPYRLNSPFIQSPFHLYYSPHSDMGGNLLLIVTNIHTEYKEDVLWQLFGPIGSVQNITIIRDDRSGRSQGIGYVIMSNYHSALYAINCLNGYQLGDKKLQITLSIPGV